MKKRILFTANLESFFTKFLIPQLKYFYDNGYEVHIATKLENKDISYCHKKFNVDFARSFSLTDNIKSYNQLKKILKENHYDIISTHTPFGGAITRLITHRLGLKDTEVVYMAHGFHFYEGAPKLKYFLFYNIEKYLAKYTDKLITINLYDFEIAKNNFKTKVYYVPGVGLDEEKFNFEMTKEEKCELRESLGLNENDYVMIYPAELLKRKRQLWLIDTLKEALVSHKDMHLLLPGNDSLNCECQNLVKKLGLEEQVHFLGFRNDIPKLLQISNLALSSSMQEGLPVNVIEAIYVGLPIVVTNCRGNKDLIINKKNGYIVDVNDKHDFNEKVLKMYSLSKEELDKIKIIDKEIIDKYLLKNVINTITNIYLDR